MANKKNQKREFLLDQCERLYIMGLRKPYHVQKALKDIKDYRTADKYLKIAARRAHRRNKRVNKDALFQKQLTYLDQATNELWAQYLAASNVSERTGTINALGRILKQKAELLGLEAPKEFTVGAGKGETFLETLSKLPENEQKRIIEKLDKVRAKPDKPYSV